MQTVNNSPNGAFSPSDTKVRHVRFHSFGSPDNFIDISMMVNYIEIFESMYSPFMSVNINVTDTNSVLTNIGIRGEEFITLDITSVNETIGIKDQAFNVYEISDRIVVSNSAVTYTIKCVSPAMFVDMNLKISKAYSGLASDLVINEFGKELAAINKPINVETTKNIISYISNYWSPTRNIKYLCDRAVSKRNSSANYLFFERKDSFRFESIDNLVVKPATNNFIFSLTTNDQSIRKDFNTQLSIMQNLYVDKSFNYIDRVTTGAYGNRSLVVDPSTKSYSYDYYDFTEAFNKHSRLNDIPIGTSNAIRRINSVFRTRIAPSNTTTTMVSESTEQWFRQRLTELASINANTIEFDAIGRFYISAGDVITVAIPKVVKPISISSSATETSTLLDQFLSGRYIVSSLRHLIDRERHVIKVQASKDSYWKGK